MELIVTHRSRLENKYGNNGWHKIDKAVEDYLDALDEAGIDADLFPIDELDPKTIKNTIRSLHDKYSANYLLLLGGDDVIPFYRCPDQTPEQPLDHHVFSDTYYVDFNELEDEHWPRMAVGRLPDGRNTEKLLVDQLQRAASIHRSGGIPLGERYAGFSTKSWETASRRTYSRIDRSGETLHLSPPLGLTTSEIINTGYFPSPGGILFFNLHGHRKKPIWLGEQRTLGFPRYTELIDYELLSQIDLANSIVLCQACHGAAIHNGRTPTDSLALCVLQQGALAFLGCTVTSYAVTPNKDKLSGASGIDALFQTLIHQLCRVQNTRLGDALQEAKQRYLVHNPWDEKNVLGLVLLGDPMLCFRSS